MKALVLTILLALSLGLSALRPVAPTKPNIILILVDDMGWGDVGCYGNPVHQTPNIDQMAASGCRYTHAYAACAVCSPSRAALMTGKHPARLKITDWIPGLTYPNAPMVAGKMRYALPLPESTLAERLKSVGYKTYHLGKWHLGESRGPQTQGFDLNIGTNQRGQPGSYFYPYVNPTSDRFVRIDDLPGQTGDYLTDRLTDEAVKLMEQSAKAKQPFFLNFWHYSVHGPLGGKPDLIETYRDRIKTSDRPKFNPTYAAMIQSLDESVGRIRQTLTRLGIAENTILVFMSDNGGLVEVNGNTPLREGKGFYYEGGIRIPWIVEYPGHIAPKQVNPATIDHVDFLPTVLEMAGLPVPKGLDGQSHARNLLTGQPAPTRPHYWHYPHYHNPKRPPTGAILAGNYKLIRFYETDRVELYDVRADVGEQHNLADKQTAIVSRLNGQLSRWLTSVGAEMPMPNPTHDPQQPFAKNYVDWAGKLALPD